MQVIKTQLQIPSQSYPFFMIQIFMTMRATNSIESAIDSVCDEAEKFANEQGGIMHLVIEKLAQESMYSLIIMISAINQRLIEAGQRFNVSIIIESGQISSSSYCLRIGIWCLGRLSLKCPNEGRGKMGKIMGTGFQKVFKSGFQVVDENNGESRFVRRKLFRWRIFRTKLPNTNDKIFAKYFPNMDSPCGVLDLIK